MYKGHFIEIEGERYKIINCLDYPNGLVVEAKGNFISKKVIFVNWKFYNKGKLFISRGQKATFAFDATYEELFLYELYSPRLIGAQIRGWTI